MTVQSYYHCIHSAATGQSLHAQLTVMWLLLVRANLAALWKRCLSRAGWTPWALAYRPRRIGSKTRGPDMRARATGQFSRRCRGFSGATRHQGAKVWKCLIFDPPIATMLCDVVVGSSYPPEAEVQKRPFFLILGCRLLLSLRCRSPRVSDCLSTTSKVIFWFCVSTEVSLLKKIQRGFKRFKNDFKSFKPF